MPEFHAELHRQREEVAREALGILEQSLTRAIETLVGLLDTNDDRLKRLICNDVLNHILKYHEIKDLDQRLGQLEAHVSGKKTA